MKRPSREYPERPIVGVGGILLEGSRILLVRRGAEPLRGEWSIPGGAVEVGEPLAEALAREMLEETGLRVQILHLVEVLDRILLGDDGRVRYHYVLLDYLCRPVGGELRAGSDASEARWVDRSELDHYGLRPETRQVIEKAFRMREEGVGSEASHPA